MNIEFFEQQAKELASLDGVNISMSPEQGYMLAAVVQGASLCLDLPETTHTFCKDFVNAFCDRYREQIPTVVQGIEQSWDNPQMMTEDEFEVRDGETLRQAWQRIASDVQQEMGDQVQVIVDTLDDDDKIESIFAVAPRGVDPETYDY
ncbi:MAG: hypothetical protein NW214_08570 [Pseudanabaenaceae cyanobacterium bins.39]|nr:hypothetical protein [Pseudanabaenaceae cyanobacterium bins.39]